MIGIIEKGKMLFSGSQEDNSPTNLLGSPDPPHWNLVGKTLHKVWMILESLKHI